MNSFVFGDGDSFTHPFSSDPGVVAHEIAHGFTSQHSKLPYEGMTGGMNESYSDITGASLKYYLSGAEDWNHGFARIKAKGKAGRYLNDPPKDKKSIDHSSKWREQMDVHHSSGVYNKAFYLLVSKNDWGVEEAFQTLTLANRLYWNNVRTFDDGVCGVMRAAKRYKLAVGDVVNAYSSVGVHCPEKRSLIGKIGDGLKNLTAPGLDVVRTDGEYLEGKAKINSVRFDQGESVTRINTIVVRGEFLPKNLELRSEDCSEIAVQYGSSDRYEFVCLLKINILQFVSRITGTGISELFSAQVFEVYDVSAVRTDSLSATVTIMGSHLTSDQVTISANECESFVENMIAQKSFSRTFQCGLVGSSESPPTAIQLSVVKKDPSGNETSLYDQLVIISD